ncbi:MAG TPA: hypothetical protein VE954_16415 [Oligoflexus sp.]|nr:hypothetical protein [Oligoflexus sp.]
MDVDGTLCPIKKEHESYADLPPIPEVLARLKFYKEQGFYVILHSSRNMRTYEGNIGQIYARTGKTLLEWLERFQVPYDEIHLGKPWPGKGGFYVDDKAIRPDEFLSKSYDQILGLIGDRQEKADQ